MKKMGYTHHDPKGEVKESRAYRDAMKSMKSRSATRGMATTKKDKDTEASDDDRKAANKKILSCSCVKYLTYQQEQKLNLNEEKEKSLILKRKQHWRVLMHWQTSS